MDGIANWEQFMAQAVYRTHVLRNIVRRSSVLRQPTLHVLEEVGSLQFLEVPSALCILLESYCTGWGRAMAT